MTPEQVRKEYSEKYTEYDRLLPKDCGNCGSTENTQIHHVVPVSFGGTNRITNLCRLCTDCHAKAHGGLSLVSKSGETRRNNASVGKMAGGSIPFGYKLGNRGSLEIDEEVAEVVRLIYRLRFRYEYSTENIAKYLNHMAIPTVRGAAEWKHPTVKRIVDNPKYLGDYNYEGENYEGVIPPIIDEEGRKYVERFREKYKHRRLSPKKLDIA